MNYQQKYKIQTDKTIQQLIAGTCSGLTCTLISQPFDIIKTRIQTDTNLYKKNSLLQSFKQILKSEGFFTFYRGVAPILIQNLSIAGLMFPIYENCKLFFKSYQNKNHQSPDIFGSIFGGSVTGALKSIVNIPIEKLKVQLQITNSQYKNSTDALFSILKQDGIKGLYQGALITIIINLTYYVVWFPTYEYTKQQLLGRTHNSIIGLIGGSLAGMAGWIAIYPMDVVKSNFQSNTNNNCKYNNYFDCVMKIYQQNGFKVFYRGLNTCLLRGIPVNSGFMLTYETIMKMQQCLY